MFVLLIILAAFARIGSSVMLCALWQLELFSDVNSVDHCPAGYEECATEGDFCGLAPGQTSTVYYGEYNWWNSAQGKPWTFAVKKDVTDGVWCTNDVFTCDPVGGTTKRCCKEKWSPPACPSLNSDHTIADRCGPVIGKRCNQNLIQSALYCNENTGRCGTTDEYKNAQSSDLYDWAPQTCIPDDVGECTDVTDFVFDDPSTSFPTNVHVIKIDYSNDGPLPSNAGNIGSNSCKQTTYSITQKTNFQFSLQAKGTFQWGTGATQGGFGGSLEITVKASIGGETATNQGTLESECMSVSFQTANCPAFSYCTREIHVTEIQPNPRAFTATLQCDHGETVYKGEMVVEGSYNVEYQDIITPMRCEFYTSNPAERDIKQPFCDECSSADSCDSCEPGYYLMLLDANTIPNTFGCVSYRGCTYYCRGMEDCPMENQCECVSANSETQSCQEYLYGNGNRRLLTYSDL